MILALKQCAGSAPPPHPRPPPRPPLNPISLPPLTQSKSLGMNTSYSSVALFALSGLLESFVGCDLYGYTNINIPPGYLDPGLQDPFGYHILITGCLSPLVVGSRIYSSYGWGTSDASEK